MADLPLATPLVRMFRLGSGFWCEVSQEFICVINEYRAALNTPEATINLSQLTLANAFEMFPMYFLIQMNISRDADSNSQSFAEDTRLSIEARIADLNEFTNNSLNLEIIWSDQGVFNPMSTV